MKNYLILIFTTFALCAFASAGVRAESNDTYNFYFQKAPGPVTVNQGGAPPTPPTLPPGATGLPTAPVVPQPAGNVVQSIAETDTSRSVTDWELSLGYARHKDNQPSEVEQFYFGNYHQPSGVLQGGQINLGIQRNFSKILGIQANVYYLSSTPKYKEYNGYEIPLAGSRWDYSAELVVTPLHLRPAKWLALRVSAIGGGMSVPVYRYEDWPPSVGHPSFFTYGARASLQFDQSVALNVTARKIDRYNVTHTSASVAYLF